MQWEKNPKVLHGSCTLYLCSRRTVGSHNAEEESSLLVRGGRGGWQVPSHTRADKPAPACSDLEDKRDRCVLQAAESHISVRASVLLNIPHHTTLQETSLSSLPDLKTFHGLLASDHWNVTGSNTL
jgi:hypothetical protein